MITVKVPIIYETLPQTRTKSCCKCGEMFEIPTNINRLVCDKCRVATVPNGNRPLSLREKQVINLVRACAANKDIASALHLSEGTVKEYMNRIFQKVGVRSRTALAVWAIEHPDRVKLPVQQNALRPAAPSEQPCSVD